MSKKLPFADFMFFPAVGRQPPTRAGLSVRPGAATAQPGQHRGTDSKEHPVRLAPGDELQGAPTADQEAGLREPAARGHGGEEQGPWLHRSPGAFFIAF
jgi:hypothetical protein